MGREWFLAVVSFSCCHTMFRFCSLVGGVPTDGGVLGFSLWFLAVFLGWSPCTLYLGLGLGGFDLAGVRS